MNVRSILVGICIGLLAGYVLFRVPGPPPARSSTASPANIPPAQASAHRDRPSADGHAPAGRRAEIFLSGTAEEIRRNLEDREPPAVSDPELQIALGRLDEALVAGDRPLFLALVRALAASSNGHAQRKLLDLMGDESIPDLTGWHFRDGLRNSGLAGIADAAQRRVEMNIARGDTSWSAGHGWFDLILLHGDEMHVDWVLSRRESNELRLQALESLVRCPAERAVRRVVEMTRAGELDSSFLADFAGAQPQVAFELIHERLGAGEWGDNKDPTYLAGIYGRCIPADRLAEARKALLALSKPASRIAAVYAIQALAARGLVLDGLDPLVFYPVEILERRPEGDARVADELVSRARFAIRYNEVTWSERSATALERAGFSDEASKVRVGLKSPWKKW